MQSKGKKKRSQSEGGEDTAEECYVGKSHERIKDLAGDQVHHWAIGAEYRT